MPATITLPPVRHEEFCLPGEGQVAPRMEQFPVYKDHPESGLSRVTHIATRCIECGAARYDPKEN